MCIKIPSFQYYKFDNQSIYGFRLLKKIEFQILQQYIYD